MDFAAGQIYHVFNRGNNSQTVFFKRENYLFFLGKIKKNISPYAEILAWCLMPNHFHLMIKVVNERIVIEPDPVVASFDPMTGVHRINSEKKTLDSGILVNQISNAAVSWPTHPMNFSHRMSSLPQPKVRTFNDSIAIMLRSYTRAINKKYDKHGSLFQQHSKAVCLTEPTLSPAYFQSQFGTMGNISFPEDEYPNACFNYIHFNPVNANLVKNPEDWEFSSYRDYYCGRNGKLINRELAKELVLIE